MMALASGINFTRLLEHFPLMQISRNLQLVEGKTLRQRKLATDGELACGALGGGVGIEQTALEHRQITTGDLADVKRSRVGNISIQAFHKPSMAHGELATATNYHTPLASRSVSKLTEREN